MGVEAHAALRPELVSGSGRIYDVCRLFQSVAEVGLRTGSTISCAVLKVEAS